ncbi:MAG: Ig-like domain-containing protein [Candidatus Nealsonbacteria bacterium]
MKQKGFIAIPLLIAIIASVIAVSTIATGVVLHKQGKLSFITADISGVFGQNKETPILKDEGLRQGELQNNQESQLETELIEEVVQQEISGDEIVQQEQKLTEKTKPESEIKSIEEETVEPEFISEFESIEDEIFDSTPKYVDVEVTPKLIVADGESRSTISVIVKNKDGLPIPNQLVIFEFVDRLSKRIKTNEHGIITIVYISDGIKGIKNIGIIANPISEVVQIEETDELDFYFRGPKYQEDIAKIKSYKIKFLGIYYVDMTSHDYEENPVYEYYNVTFLIDTNVPVQSVVIQPVLIGGRCRLIDGCVIPTRDSSTYEHLPKTVNVSNIETERYVIFPFSYPETFSFRIIITDINEVVQVDEFYPETITISSKSPDNYEDPRLKNCIEYRGYQFTELGNCLKNIR